MIRPPARRYWILAHRFGLLHILWPDTGESGGRAPRLQPRQYLRQSCGRCHNIQTGRRRFIGSSCPGVINAYRNHSVTENTTRLPTGRTLQPSPQDRYGMIYRSTGIRIWKLSLLPRHRAVSRRTEGHIHPAMHKHHWSRRLSFG